MQHLYMQAPEAAAMLLIECGASALRALHDTKAKGSCLEADVSILHTYALEGADCAHEVAMMCTEVRSCRFIAMQPLSLVRWAGIVSIQLQGIISSADINNYACVS